MLSTVGRAIFARRISTTRVSPASQLLSRHVPAVVGLSIAARAFSGSASRHAGRPRTKKPKEAKFKPQPLPKFTFKAMPKLKPLPPPRKKTPAPSPEEKQKEKAKRDLDELMEEALVGHDADMPRGLPETTWILYSAKETKKRKAELGDELMPLTQELKKIAARYRELSPDEREPFEKVALANRATNAANYRAWVEKYPVGRIWIANLARRRLSHKLNKRFQPIRDHRFPPFPGSGYTDFIQARFASGEYAGSLTETMKVVSKEWFDLSDAERKAYDDARKDAIAKNLEEMAKIRAEGLKFRKEIQQKNAAIKEATKLKERAEQETHAAAVRAVRAENRAIKETYKAEKRAAAEAFKLKTQAVKAEIKAANEAGRKEDAEKKAAALYRKATVGL